VHARIRAAVSTTKAVVTTARDKEITFLAAAVAYYAFASLLPALLLLLVVATTVGGVSFAERLVTQTSGFLTPAGQEVITEAIADAPGAGGATVIGIVLLTWSTLKVFRALDTAFLTVYGQTDTAGFGGQLRDAVLVLVGIGVGILIMVVLGVVLAALPLGPLGWLVGVLGLPGVLALALLPVYRQFPNPPISVRQALPGTVFAAVGWTLLQAGFQIYAASASQYAAYGVVGGVLLLVTWLYLAANIVILGAISNAVLAGVDSVAAPR
jgi:YihY family inner membrane protein